MSTYRFEHHRGDGAIDVVAYTDAADARQAELSELAATLLARGATGALVLVDVATGEAIARRYLWPDDRAPSRSPRVEPLHPRGDDQFP